MAIDRVHWRMILEADVKGKALSAGYPDLLLTVEDMPKTEETHDIPIRQDSSDVQAHHGWKSPIPDSAAVFKAIGLELFVFDRERIEGSEFIADLNLPQHFGEFDLVIDPGTSEHCFNIPTALMSLANAVKVGGVISQALPMSMFNHGYWNVNPVALRDFYETNGFEIERQVIRHDEGIFECKPEEVRMRMKGVPDGSVNIITARRKELAGFQWPQQKAL